MEATPAPSPGFKIETSKVESSVESPKLKLEAMDFLTPSVSADRSGESANRVGQNTPPDKTVLDPIHENDDEHETGAPDTQRALIKK